MAIAAGISQALQQLQSAQKPAQSAIHQRHGGHHGKSISDVDAQSSSVAAASSPTAKIGSKLDITV